jgi:hypothetical protein
MTAHDSDHASAAFATISPDALEAVSGGTGRGAASGSNPFAGIATFFSNLFAPVVNYAKGSVAGYKLADKMYGKSTWTEKTNNMTVMRKYFAGGFDPPASPRRHA